ncbi:MAG TPA: oxaloacetate decarboxylase [Bacteroidales bacterium]|nr:oxaloacetate decarboxylase [Bacteroidales bacterium]HOR81116.1 oxaloacetate decarboxylase [Bacteroidales bacterium]HPJ90762.1 oxaloacetate decarboxylase [Bacteroidales bacterium]HQB19613.1 oxaloacetate decarboxylase [Bacteroidales bacterium]
MAKEIKFSLLYRDMWQSSGKYVPRVDQLVQIAPVIVDMGCFARIETNGGAFEQVNLLYGENPNTAVRQWTKAFNDAGIQTHMLERALNGLRMYPVPADVRQLMPKVKKAQGVDIMRSFCGLNDHRNLELSVKYAKEAGMISQAALSITHSAIHTVEYFMQIVDKLVEYGADEIALKDMAGVGRPVALGKLVKEIKTKYPHIIVQYHGHSGPGFSVASMLEVAKNGVDYIDVAMEPLSWGMVHPDVITIQAMLREAGFLVPDINMEAYMEARHLTQTFIDDFLGYFINDKNKIMTSLLVGCGLPGGMMGSMMADLTGMHGAINMALKQNNKPEVTLDNLLVQLFQEVEYVWPKLGYPPLVTPFSQYVKNIALMNIFALAKGEKRFSTIDKDSWNMILGKTGNLPGPLAPEIIELAKEKGMEFYTANPQDAFPNALDTYRKEMIDNNWDFGQDDEELFELAMHDRQYRDYKSGIAKKRFEEELQRAKDEAQVVVAAPVVTKEEVEKKVLNYISEKYPNAKPVVAPVGGTILWEVDYEKSTPPAPGKKYKENDVIAIIQTYYGNVEVPVLNAGKLIDSRVPQGGRVRKGDIIAWVE